MEPTNPQLQKNQKKTIAIIVGAVILLAIIVTTTAIVLRTVEKKEDDAAQQTTPNAVTRQEADTQYEEGRNQYKKGDLVAARASLETAYKGYKQLGEKALADEVGIVLNLVKNQKQTEPSKSSPAASQPE